MLTRQQRLARLSNRTTLYELAVKRGESIPFIARRFKLDEATVRGRMASLGLV